jgi:hypothetical protein
MDAGGHTGAKAVHVVQDAEGGSNPDDEKNGEDRVQNVTRTSAKEKFKYLCVNSSNQQDAGGKRHSNEKFNLMVQPAPVIENPYNSDDSRTRQNTNDLGARCSTKRKQDREHHGPIHRQAP